MVDLGKYIELPSTDLGRVRHYEDERANAKMRCFVSPRTERKKSRHFFELCPTGGRVISGRCLRFEILLLRSPASPMAESFSAPASLPRPRACRAACLPPAERPRSEAPSQHYPHRNAFHRGGQGRARAVPIYKHN